MNDGIHEVSSDRRSFFRKLVAVAAATAYPHTQTKKPAVWGANRSHYILIEFYGWP